MKLNIPAILASVVLFCTVTAVSQPYQLDWQDRYVPAHTETVPAQVEKAVLEEPVRRPSVEPVYQPHSGQSEDDKAATMTVSITAEQSYDHYKGRYRKVSKVESLVYRGGYPQDTVHCNRGDYDSFDVYINDLKAGDRYKVRVTWDDGSHRTVENTIGPYSRDTVVIREPLAFDTSFES
jgi:hypothetical protein